MHGRRRRRLAADDNQAEEGTADAAVGGDGKPLPARRPTGRFPLRRLVSRSHWKLAAVGLAAAAAGGVAVAGGYVPSVRSGTFGPGVTSLFDLGSTRLPAALGGLLLVATGQLAWLIRWARARSLRDFRGGYRIWWWTSLAFVAGGIALLTDVHLALASTIAWAAGKTFPGSDAVYRFLPGAVPLVLILPALQRDMRGCRTSRTLFLTAALLWIAGAGAMAAGSRLGETLAQVGLSVPAAAVCPSLLLAGTTAAFSALLFHARHVVYESVEPPELPVRKKVIAEAEAEGDEEAKSKRAASRRTAKAKAAEKPEPKAAKAEPVKAEPKRTQPEEAPSKVAKPHFVLKEQVLKEPPKPAPVPAPKVEPVAAKPQPKPEPPKPEPPKPIPVASKPAPPASSDDDMDDEDSAEIGGRNVRLDGPEDPLHGLSKRERRKMKKEMRQRD